MSDVNKDGRAPVQASDYAVADQHARCSTRLGIASIVLSLCTGIPAVILGIKALRASTKERDKAIQGITLGALTSLLAVVIGVSIIMMWYSPRILGFLDVASADATATATKADRAWTPGETKKVGKCSYRLLKAYKRVAPEEGEQREHRLWEAVVAVEATHSDELDAFCSFNLQMRTVGSSRVLGEDSTANEIAPSSKKCMSEGIGEMVPRAMNDVTIVLQLNPDSPDDEGLLKGLARYNLTRSEFEVGADLLSWDEYTEKVGLMISCD